MTKKEENQLIAFVVSMCFISVFEAWYLFY